MQQENTGAQRSKEEEYLFQLAKLEMRIRAMSAQEREKYVGKIAEVEKHLARLTPAQRQALAGQLAQMEGGQPAPVQQPQAPEGRPAQPAPAQGGCAAATQPAGSRPPGRRTKNTKNTAKTGKRKRTCLQKGKRPKGKSARAPAASLP
ncbi:MAG: hypothetical protein ACLVEL_08295 [Ruthenibacterium sp.]